MQETPLAEDAVMTRSMLEANAKTAALLRERGWDGFLEGWGWTLSPWFQRQIDATNPEMLALWYDAYGVWDTWALLPRITAPVLMFVGGLEDPEHGTEMGARRINRSRVVRLAEKDHITAYERADLVLPAAMAFLTSAQSEQYGFRWPCPLNR